MRRVWSEILLMRVSFSVIVIAVACMVSWMCGSGLNTVPTPQPVTQSDRFVVLSEKGTVRLIRDQVGEVCYFVVQGDQGYGVGVTVAPPASCR